MVSKSDIKAFLDEIDEIDNATSDGPKIAIESWHAAETLLEVMVKIGFRHSRVIDDLRAMQAAAIGWLYGTDNGHLLPDGTLNSAALFAEMVTEGEGCHWWKIENNR